MLTILQTLQEEFHATLSLEKNICHRSYRFSEAKDLIKVAIGIRRSGKTYFLFQTIRELLAKGIPLTRILYINFEDDRIFPMDQKTMGTLIDDWYALYPSNHDQCSYIFLDEVQNIEGWALVIRRLLDTKNTQLYITGSSAKLLSKEISTSLRGRSLAIEIFPYSYTEYLASHHLELPANPFGRKGLDYHRKFLLDYFRIGGFPAVQDRNPNEQVELLQNYVETVVFRDIIERYNIQNHTLLKYFILSLLKNCSAPFSVNKFYNDIKSQGYKIAKDTLYSYLTYLEDAFLIFAVPIFSESLRKSQTTPKKIYAVDNGLSSANTFNLSDNRGKLLENQVYLDLRRQKKKIFYYLTADGYEIDFVTQDLQGKFELIQVTWDKTDLVALQRKERALEQAKQELGFPGRIIDYESYLRSFIVTD